MGTTYRHLGLRVGIHVMARRIHQTKFKWGKVVQFVWQGESIEEAVRREVMEEAGIEVSSVAILGSQPWPIGRGGSCELMIGCIAKAQSDDLHQDDTEMDEVRYSLALLVQQTPRPAIGAAHLLAPLLAWDSILSLLSENQSPSLISQCCILYIMECVRNCL